MPLRLERNKLYCKQIFESLDPILHSSSGPLSRIVIVENVIVGDNKKEINKERDLMC